MPCTYASAMLMIIGKLDVRLLFMSRACLDAMVLFRWPIQMTISCNSKIMIIVNGMAIWHDTCQLFFFKPR